MLFDIIAASAALHAAMPSIPPLPALAAVAIVLFVAAAVTWRRRKPAARGDDVAPVATLPMALWASGEHFWDYDLDRHLLYRAHAATFPVAHDRIGLQYQKSGPPTVHPRDFPLFLRRLQRHLRGKTPFFISEHRMDLDGSGQWTLVRVFGRVTERDTDGNPLRLAGTARINGDSRLADSEHRIASEVFRSMSEALAVLDRDFKFISVNPAFTRITGYEESEVLGKPVFMLDSDRHDEDHFKLLLQELERSGHWQGDIWKVRKDGEEILCQVKNNVIRDANGDCHSYVLVLCDITEQKRVEQELRYLANYDTLTGLPNRALLSERLARAIVRARRENGQIAVLFLDLDRFKDINDSLGHPVGDRVLRAAAERVQYAVGPEHTVARLSGDEFTVVLENLESRASAERVARQVINSFAEPLAVGEGREVVMSPSIGISLYPQHAETPTDLIKHSDTAMYQAKAAGRRTYQVYSAHMDEQTRRRATLANRLRTLVDLDEMALVFQPRYSLRQQRIVGVEALVRWRSEELGEVSPHQFIPLAEETGMILDIGEWALQQACDTLRQWQQHGIGDIGVSVNVSAMQLLRGNLPLLIRRVLGETGIESRHLELELTESVVMANVTHSADTLRACRELGVALAIDDFGTGYSSLAYLKRLPITTLKIDREFISDLTHDRDDEAITSTIITMGHSLSLQVVAEGVETSGQLRFLREHGCDEVQGHLISAAMEPDDCLRFLLQPFLLAESGVRRMGQLQCPDTPA